MVSRVVGVGALLVLLAWAACGRTGTVSSVPTGAPEQGASPSSGPTWTPEQGASPCASASLRAQTVHPQITATLAPPTPTPTFGPDQPLPLSHLQMLTATTGWGLAGKRVFWTRDGGAHWRDITPPDLSNGVGELHADFLTDAVGWVWGWGCTTIDLFRTTDGGQTWQRGASFSRTVVSLTFLTPQAGWALVELSNAPDTTDAEVWRTRDGGVTWDQIATTDPAAHSGRIPAVGRKTGLRFLTPLTGWMGVSALPEAALLVTQDGGISWQSQTLFQPNSTQRQIASGTPTFFNAQDGRLVVTVLSQTAYQIPFLTQDGGATWQSRPSLPAEALSAFSDAHHGWLLDPQFNISGPLQTRWAATSDGGQHWQDLPGGEALKKVVQLDFLSSSLGWALSKPGGGWTTVVLQTADGGLTWTAVTPVLL